MGLRGILSEDEPTVNDEDFIEVDHRSEHDADAVPIKISKISNYGDVEPVQKQVREGNIVLVNIQGLKNKDMSELKRAVERLRKTVQAVDGDIAGVDENFIIATPNFAKIDRSGGQEVQPTQQQPTQRQQRRQARQQEESPQQQRGGNQQPGPASR